MTFTYPFNSAGREVEQAGSSVVSESKKANEILMGVEDDSESLENNWVSSTVGGIEMAPEKAVRLLLISATHRGCGEHRARFDEVKGNTVGLTDGETLRKLVAL